MCNKVVIIGGGIAGLTASIYLARSGIKTTILTGYTLGSLSETPFVQNYPGFINGISGYQLVSNILQQAKKNNVQIVEEQAISIDSKNNTVISDSGVSYSYDGLVVATGSKPRKLQAKNANKYDTKGIHYCAVCDGALYKDKNVIVVGGGNTALTQALYLSDICCNVNIFVRKEQLRADSTLINKILQKKNIRVFYKAEITEFVDEEKLNRIFYKHYDQINEAQIDAVFVAIGSDLNDKILQDAFGNNYSNNLPNNIMLAGDLATIYHQAVIAAGNGASVALDMINFLKNK